MTWLTVPPGCSSSSDCNTASALQYTLALPPWGAFPRPDHWPTDHLLRTPPSEHHERPSGPLSGDIFKRRIKKKCKIVYNETFLTFSMSTMRFRCINKIAYLKWNSENQNPTASLTHCVRRHHGLFCHIATSYSKSAISTHHVFTKVRTDKASSGGFFYTECQRQWHF